MNQETTVTKKCSNPNCSQPIKTITEFNKHNSQSDGLQYRCKICQKLAMAKYYINNKDCINKQNNLHYSLNKTRYQEKHHQNHLQNKEKINIRHRKHYQINKKQIQEQRKQSIQNDPNKRMISSLRSRHNIALRNNQKYGHTIEQLGISVKKYNNFLESQFYNNMSWKKRGVGHGKWQIHHICPLEFFDLTNPIEQKQAFHYTNTQPLWYEDHCEEHRKINKRIAQYDNKGRPIILQS